MDKGVGIGEVIALHKALGGGGGSSGGGVMKIGVNKTESGGKDIFTLDKTWKQIADAIDAGEVPYCVYAYGSDYSVTIVSTVYQSDEDGFVVSNRVADYTTNSENGYPSYTEEGSNY